MALNLAEQKRVWDGLYTSEVRNNFYAFLSLRYQRRQVRITWLTLLLSGGAAATFVTTKIAQPYPLVPPILSIVTAAISAYSLVAKNEKKGIDSSRLSQKYAQVALSYEVMFGRMHLTTSEELQKLDEKKTELGEAGHSLDYSKRLMSKAERHVKEARGF